MNYDLERANKIKYDDKVYEVKNFWYDIINNEKKLFYVIEDRRGEFAVPAEKVKKIE